MKSIETIKDKQFLTILNEKGKRKEDRRKFCIFLEN
jgi:hypothetical protein